MDDRFKPYVLVNWLDEKAPAPKVKYVMGIKLKKVK